MREERTPRLLLLRLRDLYVVAKGYGSPPPKEDDTWPDFLIHSHECPENIMHSVMAVYHPTEGIDPHGMFRFVAMIDAVDTESLPCDVAGLLRLFHTDGTDAPSDWPASPAPRPTSGRRPQG